MLNPRRAAVRLPWGLAWRLALGQIVSWGILYYAFTVVAGPLHDATGWSRTFVNVGLTLGLLAWGVAAWPVGLWIQRRGTRGLMTLASLVGGAAFAALGLADGEVAYLALWLVLGAAMAGALYEPAFAAVTQAFAGEYRRGITLITLVAGFASTLFIPLAQLAVERLGWRGALIGLGIFQIAVGVPLHWFGLPRFPRPAASEGERPALRLSHWLASLRQDVRDPRYLGLAVWFSAQAAAATGLVFQIVPLLQSRGVPTSTILTAIAVMGPMQVLGRFVLVASGSRFSAVTVGRWAMAALLGAIAVLLAGAWELATLAVFAGLFGLGNGVLTIVRGTAVSEFYGRSRYAELNGALSAPGVVAKAAAPLAFGAVWSATGEPQAVTVFCAILLGVSTVGLWIAARQQPAPPTTQEAAA